MVIEIIQLVVVYTTSYVRQFLVGAVYYTARTYIGHDDRSSAQLWRSLSYIRGGITEIGYFASWQQHFSAHFPPFFKNIVLDPCWACLKSSTLGLETSIRDFLHSQLKT